MAGLRSRLAGAFRRTPAATTTSTGGGKSKPKKG